MTPESKRNTIQKLRSAAQHVTRRGLALLLMAEMVRTGDV